MRSHHRFSLFILATLFATFISAGQSNLPSSKTENRAAALFEPDRVTRGKIAQGYGKLPLSFEVNQGQTDARVKFLSSGSGYTLFLTGDGAVLSLHKGAEKSEDPSAGDEQPATNSVLHMQILGANSNAAAHGVDELLGKSNYFIGNDPKKWRTQIANYSKVRYERVYPGIDLVYYGNQRQLEYDFVVAPGADPDRIRLKFRGAEALRINDQGELVLGANEDAVRMQKPQVYQESGGTRKAVAGRYWMAGEDTIGFRVADYDHSKPLIIDPILIYSTYLGGSGADTGAGIAVDSAGNAYVIGSTQSTNFPTMNPLQPALSVGGIFVAKLNPGGMALVYSTYLGGSGGDQGFGIAVDSAGNAYVTGGTSSADFPTVNPSQPTYGGGIVDTFVAKLNPTGSALVYSTYLGGSLVDYGVGIAVDSSGNAYVIGETDSTNFPTMNPLQPAIGGGIYDAFVAKLNPTGSALVYSTYLGGSGYDQGAGIAVDSAGNAYVTGTTSSNNFPTVNPLQPTLTGFKNAFVTKLNPTGSALAYSTYLGGSQFDQGAGIAVDSSGNAYVTGATSSNNFPTVNPLQPTLAGFENTFVAKLNPSGSALLYSTYLGGSGVDSGTGVAVDTAGNAYVTGATNSTDFPTVNPSQPTYGGGSNDAFVAKLNPSGSALLNSTYLGGNGDEGGVGVAVDRVGSAYVIGSTISANFPLMNPLQPAYGGGFYDAFVAKIGSIYAGLDTTTQGAWNGKYGGDGYLIPNGASRNPAYAVVSVTGALTYTWAGQTSDARALQSSAGATTRTASTYTQYPTNSFNINVNITDRDAHQVALYLLDWDTATGAETITVRDAITNAVLDTETFSGFHNGQYAVWNIEGNVIITVTPTSGTAVVSGIFFGSAGPPSPPPAALTSSATYVGPDTTTQGTWVGKYGKSGYNIANGASQILVPATVSVTGDFTYTWAELISDVSALQSSPVSSSRIASSYTAYYGMSFNINANLTDGNTHQVGLYLLDWDTTTRSQTITIRDAITNTVLDTETFSGFHNGLYARWNVTGNVTIQVTPTGGTAVVSGIFLD